jgi:hypothetical protein
VSDTGTNESFQKCIEGAAEFLDGHAVRYAGCIRPRKLDAAVAKPKHVGGPGDSDKPIDRRVPPQECDVLLTGQVGALGSRPAILRDATGTFLDESYRRPRYVRSRRFQSADNSCDLLRANAKARDWTALAGSRRQDSDLKDRGRVLRRRCKALVDALRLIDASDPEKE